LLKPGGFFLALKGPALEKELAKAGGALALLGGAVKECRDFVLPFSREQRRLLLIEKIAPTPNEYPRRPGMAAKRPL
jgi:16S rRNA (guanine527-N7)-methyltransferase